MESKINQKKNCVRHRGQRRDHEKNNIKIHKRSQDIHYCSAGGNDGVVCSPSYPVWHAGYAAVRGGASHSCTAGCLCVPADVRGKKEGKEKIKKTDRESSGSCAQCLSGDRVCGAVGSGFFSERDHRGRDGCGPQGSLCHRT